MVFDSIVNYLPNYAQDASYAISASKILFERKDELKLALPEFKPDIDCDTVEISKRLHFEQIESVLDIQVKRLRFLNPQYKYDIVPAMNRVYIVLIPKGKLEAFNMFEDSIYRYKDSVLFQISQKVVLPPPSKGRHYAKAEPEKVPENMAKVYYTIKSGDNLGYVAEWYDVNLDKLQGWNNIYDPRKLQIGQKLKIYVPQNKLDYYKKIEYLSFEQKQKLDGTQVPVTKSRETKVAEKPKTQTTPVNDLGNNYIIHIVKNGESPYLIAKNYPGVSAEDILRWNRISDPKQLRVGQKLKIKKL